jgi:hypothetical protein
MPNPTDASISQTLSDILTTLKETNREITELGKKMDAAVVNLTSLVQIARDKPKAS